MEAIENFVENDGSHELFLRPLPSLWLYANIPESVKRERPSLDEDVFIFHSNPPFLKASVSPNMDMSHLPLVGHQCASA